MATKGHPGAGRSGKPAGTGTAKGQKRKSASAGNHKTKRKKNNRSGAAALLHRLGPRAAAIPAAVLLLLVAAVFVLHTAVKALGPKAYDVPTAEFRRDGSIRVTSVESFEEDYYDAAELKSRIREAVAAYNEAGGSNLVRQSDFAVTDGTAKVVLTYASSSDYRSFNNMPLFVGTVREAQEEGYDLSSLLSSVSQEDSSRILNEDTLSQLSDNGIILWMEQTDMVVPEEILYATPNLSITDSTHAAAADTISQTAPAIIVLKN